jgi:signal transduction histidine kinase
MSRAAKRASLRRVVSCTAHEFRAADRVRAEVAQRLQAGPRRRLGVVARRLADASAALALDPGHALELIAQARATLSLGIEELQVLVRGLHQRAPGDAADRTRRAIERDLHDGAQQRLVSLLVTLQLAERVVGRGEVVRGTSILEEAVELLTAGIRELTQLAGGVPPDALRNGGLATALRALAEQAAVDVELDVAGLRPASERVEAAAYFVVSEALTNTLKHAAAGRAAVAVRTRRDELLVTIADDGRGGADIRGGSGLRGLGERVQALGGRLLISSPAGGGTVLTALLPVSP